MAVIGYHASHEQFKPSELLKWAIYAEQCGFKAANCSDHFNPWSERQGQSGFSFAWLGAALQATTIPFSVVCTPGYRYHPALVAQAIATLEEMFPERFSISLGSGEALNEKIMGITWPSKQERNERLKECTQIIKRLLQGETVTHHGHTVTDKAKLYTRPLTSPLMLGAAVSKETAAWLGTWADGLITVSKPYEELKEVVNVFRENGGAGKPIYLKVQLSYAETESKAEDGAYDQWRNNIFPNKLLEGLSTVEEFDKLGQNVKPQDLHKMVRISSDPEQHIKWLRDDISLGFDKIILHNVNREQELFIRDFGKHVLPLLT